MVVTGLIGCCVLVPEMEERLRNCAERRKANAVPNFKILNSPLASPASQSPQKEKIGFPTVSGLPSPMRWFKPPASGALIRAK
jgi:hypothetical protein